VGSSGLVVSHELVVAMDYGQFALHGGSAALEESDLLALLDTAQGGEGVAGDGRSVLVISPHQNNFKMPLRVEVLRQGPADDLDQWDEAFEATVDVDEGGEMWYSSPTVEGAAFAVPPCRYRVRISGRGIVTRGWPGSTAPGDSWRVQMWPTTNLTAVRRLRAWAPR
jgi:hypothetical protein